MHMKRAGLSSIATRCGFVAETRKDSQMSGPYGIVGLLITVILIIVLLRLLGVL
jgi:hypothetical protein